MHIKLTEFYFRSPQRTLNCHWEGLHRQLFQIGRHIEKGDVKVDQKRRNCRMEHRRCVDAVGPKRKHRQKSCEDDNQILVTFGQYCTMASHKAKLEKSMSDPGKIVRESNKCKHLD